MVSPAAHSPPQTRHTPASAGVVWLVFVVVLVVVGWDSLFCSFICSIPSGVVVWFVVMPEPGRKVGFFVYSVAESCFSRLTCSILALRRSRLAYASMTSSCLLNRLIGQCDDAFLDAVA